MVEEGNLSDGALVLEEIESTLVVHPQVGELHDVHPNPVDVPRLLLELSVYVVGLLAVQTACALWLFGGANVREGKRAAAAATAETSHGTLGQAKGVGPEVGEGEVEFERVVSTIQAMARKAREAEAREVSEEDGISGLRRDVMEEVKKRLARLRKKKPRVDGVKAFPSTLVKGDGSKANRAPAKGFNVPKRHAASKGDLGNGGAPTIAHDSHFRDPLQRHVWKKSNTHGDSVPEKETASSRDQVILDLKNSQTFGSQNASDQGIVRRSISDHTIAIDEMLNNHMSQGLVEDSSPIGEGIRNKEYDTYNNASVLASKTKNTVTSHSQSLSDKKRGSSSMYRKSYTNSEIVSDKKTESNHLREKAEVSEADAVNQLWWLKLPFVLAIFLHRGFDHKDFKGLYSLKMDSFSEDGSHSYTIVFQDRVDAANFCYLLESFFENLDDFSADVVPLSIQEVHDAVKSKTLKVIVVRKGQLQLYAGQPLSEAEMQLRSMLD